MGGAVFLLYFSGNTPKILNQGHLPKVYQYLSLYHKQTSNLNLFFFKTNFLLIYLFLAALGSSLLCLVGASGSYCLTVVHGLFIAWLHLLWNTGSRCVGFDSCGSGTQSSRGSVVVVHGLTCLKACGIFQDQDWEVPVPCIGRQSPLDHQGSPINWFLIHFDLYNHKLPFVSFGF